MGAPRSVLTLRPPPEGTSCCLGLAGTRVMLTTAGISLEVTLALVWPVLAMEVTVATEGTITGS